MAKTADDEIREKLSFLLGRKPGGDPKRPGFQEADRRSTIARQMREHPLLAREAFGEQKIETSFGPHFFQKLLSKHKFGELSESEKAFIREQAIFSDPTRTALFSGFLADAPRIEGVIQAREQVEADRKARPGRTQTILTRREK